jgi:hypothetical protein
VTIDQCPFFKLDEIVLSDLRIDNKSATIIAILGDGRHSLCHVDAIWSMIPHRLVNQILDL